MVCAQVVDTVGVVGRRCPPTPSRRWRSTDEASRWAPVYGGRKRPDVRKSADLAASKNNSNSSPPPEVAMYMRDGVRLSGHTRSYCGDSLPKGLSWMPGYRIEPLRQRCSYDPTDSSVTSVLDHSLLSRSLPHNARRGAARRTLAPKLQLYSSNGGVVYQLVCAQFQPHRRSRKNENNEECKGEVGIRRTENEQANSEKEASEVGKEDGINGGTSVGSRRDGGKEMNGVDDVDGATTGHEQQDTKRMEEGKEVTIDNSRNEDRNNKDSMGTTYRVKATWAGQQKLTYTEARRQSHESVDSSINSDSSRSNGPPSASSANGSAKDSDSAVESIDEDINIGNSDNDARNTIQFISAN